MTPSQTSRRRFQSILSFMQITIVSVAVSASRQWQTFLLAWRERDESLTWWWQDNRRSANANLLFLGKASYSCSQRCLQTVLACTVTQWKEGLESGKWKKINIQKPLPRIRSVKYSKCEILGKTVYLNLQSFVWKRHVVSLSGTPIW